MKKILKILIALSIALMLYIVISDSFTTVKAGNDLDIQKYMLSSNDEIIAQSDSGYFELIPDETIEDINLVG